MIVITSGLCLPSISYKHEFGHKSYPKMLSIGLIFFTIIFTKKQPKGLFNLINMYVGGNYIEGIPQYREQIKKIKSKARVQAKKDVEQQIKWIEQDRDRYYNDYNDLKNKVSGLRNLAFQVRNIKVMTDEELENI